MDDFQLRQKDYWDSLGGLDPDASVIDPNDRLGHKNAYLAALRDRAFATGLAGTGVHQGMILDLGCGTGSATRALLRSGYRILGFDISRSLLVHARRRCGDADVLFAEIDGRHLPVAAATLDAAITYGVICYLPKDVEAVALLGRVRQALKPGAPLVMIEQARVRRRLCDNGLKVQRTLAEWVGLLHAAGFRDPEAVILRHGRFPTTPLIRLGLVPRGVFPALARLEQVLAELTGVWPWDYADVRFTAHA